MIVSCAEYYFKSGTLQLQLRTDRFKGRGTSLADKRPVQTDTGR
jgi:hypothetical protein